MSMDETIQETLRRHAIGTTISVTHGAAMLRAADELDKYSEVLTSAKQTLERVEEPCFSGSDCQTAINEIDALTPPEGET